MNSLALFGKALEILSHLAAVADGDPHWPLPAAAPVEAASPGAATSGLCPGRPAPPALVVLAGAGAGLLKTALA